MVEVTVEYCAPCRVSDDAVAAKRVLADRLRGYDNVDEVTLSPASDETFCVTVDDEAVWCVDPAARIDPIEAVEAVRAELA